MKLGGVANGRTRDGKILRNKARHSLKEVRLFEAKLPYHARRFSLALPKVLFHDVATTRPSDFGGRSLSRLDRIC
jgi:hypothetical protein